MWLKRIRNPLLFQGSKKRKNYFEGWYFKQVSSDLKTIISIIPGISLDERDPHCFIQVIVGRTQVHPDNNSLLTGYFPFPLKDFSTEDMPFSVVIGENRFSEAGIDLNLKNEKMKIKGQIVFGPFQVIKSSWISPGIMGPFAFMPGMECSHGIVSMGHTVEGWFELNDQNVSFDAGRGYIEKDWGTSFPRSYLWLHSNHFNGWDTSFMCSVAHIPFLGTSFEGFLCNLQVKGKEYRFATYNGSRVKVHEFTSTRTRLELQNKKFVLKIEAVMENGGVLKAPHQGSMVNQIKEGLLGTVELRLETVSGELIFEGLGSPCGIELMPWEKPDREGMY